MHKEAEDKWVIIIGCLLLFSIQFIAHMVIVALPTISLDLNLNVEMENAINLAFLITSVSLSFHWENMFQNMELEDT